MRQFPVILLLFNITLLVQAQPYDLYEGRVPIETSHDIHAQENFKQALTQVLMKLSGDAKKPQQALIQENLGDIDPLIKDYTYQILPEGNQRILVVHFDPTQTHERLSKLALPHWPDYASPLLLGWIGVEKDFLTEDTSFEEVNLLKNQSIRRGVTLSLPLFDLEDIAVLKPSDLDSKVKIPVAKMIQRYGISTVLVAWVFRTPNQWQSQWHLYIANEEIIFHHAHTQRSILLSEAINWAIDEMAKHLAKVSVSPPMTSDETFEFLVVGLPSLQEHAQINDYLKKLPIVTEIQVLSIQRGQVKFRVSIEGGKKAFLQAVSLGTLPILQQENDRVFRFKKLNKALE